MVTEIIRAIAYDALCVTRQEDFFSTPTTERKKLVQKTLDEKYPELLQDYIASVKEATFEQDFTSLLPFLSGGQSAIPESKRLVREKNLFLKTILSSLREILVYKARTTKLGITMHRIQAADKTTQRTLERELQTLLLVAVDQDSPIIQLATDAPIDTSSLQGIPSITVQKSLLGGSRLFYNGKVKDHSWKARLIQVLQATIK